MTIEIQGLPIEQDITIVRGGDWHETINLFEDDQITHKNTTGYDCEMTISEDGNGRTYDVLNISNGKIIHTALNGQFNLNLTAAEIEEYSFSSAVRKIIITDNAGGKIPLIVGKVKVIS